MLQKRLFLIIDNSVTVTTDASSCKNICKDTLDCHGYVHINQDNSNDPLQKGRCNLKYGNVHINGTHSLQTTAGFV